MLRTDAGSWIADPSAYVGQAALTWAMLGAFAGLVFALLVAQAKRGVLLGAFTMKRALAFGAIAGMTGVLVGAVEQQLWTVGWSGLSRMLVNAPVCAALGAVSGWLVLRLAQASADLVVQGSDSHPLMGTGGTVEKIPERPALHRRR